MWEFHDDRGRTAVLRTRPQRVAAYAQAGATLWDLGVRPVGLFGSQHDGARIDMVKTGRLPVDEIPYLGAGAGLDLDGLLATRPELVVTVTYDGAGFYGLPAETAEAVEGKIPAVALSVAGGRSLRELRKRFAGLARALGAAPDGAAPDSTARGGAGGGSAGGAEQGAEHGPEGRPGRAAPGREPGGGPGGGEAPGPGLAAAEDALRRTAGSTPGAGLVALSPAGPDTVYVARPDSWPDLRALSGLGVRTIAPAGGPGLNWATVGWAEAAALRPDIVLCDARSNAVRGADPDAVAAWREIAGTAAVLPWNPELPCSERAHADLFTQVAGAYGTGA